MIRQEALRLADRIHVLAGAPVRAGPATDPPGAAPRDMTDPALLPLQRALLDRLGIGQ